MKIKRRYSGHLWTWHFYTWNKKTILQLENSQVEYLPTEAAMANNRAHVGYLNMSHGSSPKPCMFSTRTTMDSKRLCRSERGIFQVRHVTASTANIELATSSWKCLLLCYQYSTCWSSSKHDFNSDSSFNMYNESYLDYIWLWWTVCWPADWPTINFIVIWWSIKQKCSHRCIECLVQRWLLRAEDTRPCFWTRRLNSADRAC